MDKTGPRDELLSASRVLVARLLSDHFQRRSHSAARLQFPHVGPLAGEASPATRTPRTLRHDLECLFVECVMELVTQLSMWRLEVNHNHVAVLSVTGSLNFAFFAVF